MIAMSHTVAMIIGIPVVPTVMCYAYKFSIIVHFDYTMKRGMFR